MEPEKKNINYSDTEEFYAELIEKVKRKYVSMKEANEEDAATQGKE